MGTFQRFVTAEIFAVCLVGFVPCVSHAGYTLAPPTGEEASGSSDVNIMRSSTKVGEINAHRSLSYGTTKYGNSYVTVDYQNTSFWTETTPADNEITAYTKWEWNHDGQDSTALYRFEYDVRAIAYASAALDIESVVWGKGKIVTHGWAKLTADTANSDVDSSEKSVWAGVQVIQDSGGLSRIGLGLTEGSIEWDNPNPQIASPSETHSEIVAIAGTDDDPGSQCFVQIMTKAWGKAHETKYTTDLMSTDESRGKGYLDTSYGDLDLEGPRLINP